MGSLPPAFDVFRCAYRGASDSINDLDVDPHGSCVYAACSSGDVFVWDVATRQLRAQLRHSRWVNAVRCFPLANSSASSTALSSSSSASPSPGSVPLRSELRWVLTATEDGVVAVWSPVTFRTQSSCRPSMAAITALQLLPLVVPLKKKTGSANSGAKAGGAAAEDSHETSPAPSSPAAAAASSGGHDTAAILCAASLLHIHVLKVTSASAELTMLRSLQHSVLVTAMTPVRTAASPLLLAVGQEDGTMCLWDCVEWIYRDTLPYPAGETDVEEDAVARAAVIHEPQFEHGSVLNTFGYNKRRCNSATHADDDPRFVRPPRVSRLDYQRSIPTTLTPTAVALVEQRYGPLPRVPQPGKLESHLEAELTASTLKYDVRRITCMAARSAATASGSGAQLFTGHATGEVLLWACPRKDFPFLLLKKMVLFRPGAWAWGMSATQTFVTTVTTVGSGGGGGGGGGGTGSGDTKAGKAKPKTLLSRSKPLSKAKGGTAAASAATKAAGAATTTSTSCYSPLELVVWTDSGVVEYVSTANREVTHRQGQGFMASAATCWVGEVLPGALGMDKARDDASGGAAQGKFQFPTEEEAGGGAAAASLQPASLMPSSPSLSLHQYLLMGNFEGRVERFDVTESLGLIKTFGKAH